MPPLEAGLSTVLRPPKPSSAAAPLSAACATAPWTRAEATPAAAKAGPDVEAGDRPRGLFVRRRQRPGAYEPPEGLPRPYAAPSDGVAVDVRQQAGGRTFGDQRLEPLAAGRRPCSRLSSVDERRQTMHQHPPRAPLGPKTRSRSSHRSGVTGRTSIRGRARRVVFGHLDSTRDTSLGLSLNSTQRSAVEDALRQSYGYGGRVARTSS